MSIRVESGGSDEFSDFEPFVARLQRRQDEQPFFAAGEHITVARAPGRLDFMGGIADYSGSLVLQLPLAVATYVAVQRTPRPELVVESLDADGPSSSRSFSMPLSAFSHQGKPICYAAARALFASNRWAAYVAGALLVLMRERAVSLDRGLRILVISDVPAGVGIASSAALEVAAMHAIARATDLALAPRNTALLCQIVENRVAGAACGLMDQMTAACGEPGRLLALLCQPAELRESVPVPAEIELWGIDSGVHHSVAGADYESVRVGAFMGYRILAEHAGLEVDPGPPLTIDDPRWNGYLANVDPHDFQHDAHALPIEIRGGEFLARYGGTTDAATTVDPGRTYPVRMPTAHPIWEHQRVALTAEILRGPLGEEELLELGELMYASHESYSACGLGSDATDALVELVAAAGAESGVYGAKITGGGSGGTVAVLARPGADDVVADIAAAYEKRAGRPARLWGDSSGGAAAFGAARLQVE